MTPANSISLVIKSLSCNESLARSVIAAFCVELEPSLEEINDIKTSVSEAVTNSIVHGYENMPVGWVTLNAAIEGNILHIEIIDNGIGINDIAKAREAFFTTKPEDERSGMGFTVMESFMDSLAVEQGLDGGTIVKMTKKICGARERKSA